MKLGLPLGYGVIEGVLMLLFFVLFVLPMVFILLCWEYGVVEAVRIIREE